MGEMLREEEVDGIVEGALESVCGYVDPVAHALASLVAASNDAGRIAKALASTLGSEEAARVAAAILRRDRPEAESESDEDGVSASEPVPEWARSSDLDLDAQLAAFDAWVRPDARERRAA